MLVSGAVHINGEPAPAGTEIKAMIAGKIKGSYTILQQGVYGIAVEYGQGTVELYVNNIKAQSINWSSEPKTLDLSVTMNAKTQSTQSTAKNASTEATITAVPTTTIEPKTAASTPESNTPQATATQDRVEKSEAVKTPGSGLFLSLSILFVARVIIRRKAE
ncbi:MAG: hypothetical protein L6265_08055 [Thermoplasmatales archaeon]|nr:hypothetical protein [Thermoplasmatales archaeon]